MSWKLATLDEIKSLAIGDKVKVNGTETTVHNIYDRNGGDYGFNTVEEFRKQTGHYSQIVGWYGDEAGLEGGIKVYVWEEEPTPFGKQLFGHKIRVKDEEQLRLLLESLYEVGATFTGKEVLSPKETPEQIRQRGLREQYEAAKKQLEELGKQIGVVG